MWQLFYMHFINKVSKISVDFVEIVKKSAKIMPHFEQC